MSETGDRNGLLENEFTGRTSDHDRVSRAGIDQTVNHVSSNPSEPVKFTSQLSALFIIVNVTVGTGLLAMPAAMQTSGIVSSLIIQVPFLLAIIISCIMCTEMTVKTSSFSYHDVIKAHCHPYIYIYTQVTIMMIVYGTVVAYLVTIGDQTDRLFAFLYGDQFCKYWYLNRTFVMSAINAAVIIPLCCAKTVDFLKYGSFLGVLSIGFIVYVVISEFVKQNKVAPDVNYIPKSMIDFATILPVFCLAYQCHLSWIPTVATVRREERYTSYKTISVAMVIASAIYTVVSTIAVLNLGSSVQSDLTESYNDKKNSILKATVAIVALKCAVTLPPAFLPARLSLIELLERRFSWYANLSETVRRTSVTVMTLNISLMLALYVPNILVAVNILGCLSVVFIFNLPGLAYLKSIKDNRMAKQLMNGGSTESPTYSSKDKIKIGFSWFLIIFGFVMLPLSLYTSVERIISGASTKPLCVV